LYKEFFLPKRATLHIYKPDKSQVRGAFTSANNKEDRVFATALLKGESVVLEYYEPLSVKGQGVIHIGTFNHGYRGYGENNAATGNSGNCMNDVNCSSNATWQTVKRAVGKWTRNGNTWCSGTLMNNTNQDCRPLFLTANHCIDAPNPGFDAVSNNGPFNTEIFYWNFETAVCNLGQQGDDTQTTVGIKTVLANPFASGAASSSSDFALFELDENPKSAYNVYFAGWDASGSTGTGGAGIHHPAGDVKKISIHSLTPASAVSNRYWRINPWDVVSGNRSVTEGGSSGSALFRSNGRVIGQLFGSFTGINPNCTDPVNDTGDYGKLSYSWTNNGAADSRRRLNVHFDPVGSGATTVINGSSNPCGTPSNVVCDNALNINCGSSRTVNTMNATSDGNPGPGICGVSLIETQKGVWYKFIGNGKQVTVSTNNSFTNFDTKLAVFRGSCTNLICIGGNDDVNFLVNTKSEFKFVSTNGVTYYIHLAGFAGATGNARVRITCCDLPEAKCRNRNLNLLSNGTRTIGNNYVNDGSTYDCGLGSRILSKKNFNCNDVGPNSVTYTITDACGNTSSCSATITVKDNTPPVANCKNITVFLDATGNVSITGGQLNNGSNDACGIQSLTASPSAFDCSTVGSQMSTLTVTDANGNTATCNSNVFVNPTAALPPDLSPQNCGSCNQLRIFYCQFDPAPSPLNDFIDGTVQMNGSYVPGNPLYWYNDAGGSQGTPYAGTGAQPPVPDLSTGNKNYYYWVAQVNQNTGCIGNAIRVRIRVRKTPILSFDTPPLPFCLNGQVDLAEWVSDANNVADKYDFYDADPDLPGANLLGSVTATNGTVDPLMYVVQTPQVGNNTYWVVGTNKGNSNSISCTAKASMTIPVAAPADLAPIPNLTVNNGDLVYVPFSSTNADYIVWVDHVSFNNPNIGIVGSAGLGNLFFTAQNGGAAPITAMIRAIAYKGNCAGQVRDFYITVNPALPGARQGMSNSLALAAYKLNQRDVRLAWDIVYDQDLVSFEIERFKEGADNVDELALLLGSANWEKIATVDYSHNSISYSFIDKEGMSHLTKYRLKLIHADGRIVWSEAVEVNFDFFEGDRFVIFPNPSNGHFQLRSALPISDNWTYQISDALGRIITSGALKEEEQSFDISEQPVGVYFLILHSPQGQRFLKRVVRK
jgi:hypothetical protein